MEEIIINSRPSCSNTFSLKVQIKLEGDKIYNKLLCFGLLLSFETFKASTFEYFPLTWTNQTHQNQ